MSRRPIGTHFSTASLVMLSALLTSSCTASTPAAAGADGGAEGGGAGGANESVALTCPSILDCASKCAANDSKCEDACLAQGSPAAKDQVNAIVACVTKNSCEDSACFEANCQSELKACVAAPAKGAGQPLGNVPPGNVPGDIVGSYASARFGETTRVTLVADGTGTYQTGSAARVGSCVTTDSFFYTGNAVVTSDTITIYAAAGVEHRFTVCGGSSATETLAPATEEVKYTREDADTLKTINSACAKRIGDESTAQGKPVDYNIAVYCTERLKRE